MNRLSESKSPYLLQHKDNPIHWWPWGDEAFERALIENKPVFLSVGYSTCHWCHVMAHESFEDENVAQFLNDNFVCIKLDREERPDVDETYMTAVQLSSGRGGWPMTLFLLPDRRPFFAGTYFPPSTHGHIPGFRDLCRQILEAYQHVRDEVEKAATEFENAMRAAMAREMEPFSGELDWAMLDDAVYALQDEFDEEEGGFGNAPKFPPHTALEFLLSYSQTKRPLATEAFAMARLTLQKMALGGIHDIVGGGFHRYSTDNVWLLPHFEKTLYDNAQLLSTYSLMASLDDDPLFRCTGQGIVDWIEREMTSSEGLFFSGLDADSEGEEGTFYTWTHAELEHFGEFLDAYGALKMGNFVDEASQQRTGRNILAWQRNLSPMTGQQLTYHRELRQLLLLREKKPRPSLDNKCLAAWNGLMITGLIRWYTATGATRSLDIARKALQIWTDFEELPHQVIDGEPLGWAFLDDYAYLTQAALEMHQVEPNAKWEGLAQHWGLEMISKFYDEENGGFFYTDEGHEELFGRSKSPLDNACPSPNGIATQCLIRLGYPEKASKTLVTLSGWMHRIPHATESLHLALQMALHEDAVVVTQRASAEVIDVERPPGQGWRAKIRIRIPQGWTVHSVDGLSLTLNGREVASLALPEIIRDTFDLLLPLGDADLRGKVELRLQVCNDRECLPFQIIRLGL
ncbi:MAG: thioredoxin domain-containing protein [Armatimonadetes bacterium]|nr:thioredoxin domain-containing protein [Armatimonadota bacterium]